VPARAEGDVDASVGDVVAQCVLQEVGQQGACEPRVAGDRCGAERSVDCHLLAGRVVLVGLDDVAGDLGEVEGFVVLEVLLAAGEGEQRFDQLLVVGAGVEDVLVGGFQRVEGESGRNRCQRL
jgi:hypothetical protein